MIAIAVDCHDVDLVSAFWARALGQDVGARWEDPHGAVYVELDERPPAFGRPVLLFQQVFEARRVKNRVHIDVVLSAGDTVEREVQRLVGLGATVTADEDDLPWAVLADPEGNEFCVLSGPRE
jgi:predicted enzyme related to lactoylglutathione lyase